MHYFNPVSSLYAGSCYALNKIFLQRQEYYQHRDQTQHRSSHDQTVFRTKLADKHTQSQLQGLFDSVVR